MKPAIDSALAEAVSVVIREHHPALAPGGYRDCSCGQNADEKGALDQHLAQLVVDSVVGWDRAGFRDQRAV